MVAREASAAREAMRGDGRLPLDTPIRLGVAWANTKTYRCRVARYDLQGSLDLLVLKTLAQRGRLHGYGIVQHIRHASQELLRVEEGSLYPALHRMVQRKWIASEWALTETGRRAKYYQLTAAGRARLKEAEGDFEELVKGVRAVLRYA